MECIPNRIFDEIRIGDAASTARTLSERDLELFIVLAGGDTALGRGGEFYATTDMLQQVAAPACGAAP